MGKSIDIGLLLCQQCKSKLKTDNGHKISCINCGSVFYYHHNTLLFKQFNANDLTDDLDKLKSVFKKWDKLYRLLIQVLSPVFPQLNLKRFMKEYIHDETVAINLGSGNSNISDKITNVDIFPFKNVNICCDIESLPIIPDSVDVIINIAVLEHVPNPENVMNEVYRVLKPGGTVFTYYPFMQPFHASPYDYSRRIYTINS